MNSNTASGRKKILLVEDNEMNRDVLSRRLERQGYQVIVAVDGQQGVALAGRELPALILMDMSLPVLDGWKATRQIRATGNRVSIIALTAHAMQGDEQKAKAAGCDNNDVTQIELQHLANVYDVCGAKRGGRFFFRQSAEAKGSRFLFEVSKRCFHRGPTATNIQHQTPMESAVGFTPGNVGS